MDKLKFVKFIVGILTFLLIFGIISAGMIICKKTTKPSKSNQEINLEQPKGSHISDFTVHDGNLYILIKGKGLSDRIVVIDTASQTVITTIKNSSEK